MQTTHSKYHKKVISVQGNMDEIHNLSKHHV